MNSIDKKAYSKLAQLEKALEKKSDIKIIRKILEKEGDIDYAIPVDSHVGFLKPHLLGCTALHLATCNSDAFVHLLNRGADFTKRNKTGQTALHMLIEQHQNIKEPLDDLLVTSVLSAHVTRNNFSNPCNNHGLSHFHIACMTNNSRAVEFFLNNGILIDHPVCINSKFSPGYTPLHFAAMCTNAKLARILLAYGADMHILDASGKTALHVLIERRMQMFESVGKAMSDEEGSYKKLQVQIRENDKLINRLLEHMSTDNDCLDSIGLSNFHGACALQDTSVAERLADRVTDINHCVHKDSKLWPGYTALHFAAHFSSSTVEMLMKKGANIELKDSKGMTPLDLCIERYKIADICRILSLNAKWKDILFSDGKTTLVSFISTLTDINNFKALVKNKDINMCISMKSPLWPGYTPLHLAVLFADRRKLILNDEEVYYHEISRQILRICLGRGADLSMQDSRGQTALHLAFRLNKMNTVDALFSHSRIIPNVSDEDYLSHLHILCVCRNTSIKLKKFVLGDLGVNLVYKGTLPVNCVKPGWTPLHVCLVNRRPYDDFNSVLKILLDNGANPYIKDAYGLTPIHWILTCSSFTSGSKAENNLLNQVPNDCVAEEYGVNNLHVVCKLNNYDAAKRFLENGANVNSAIKYTQRHDNEPLSFLSRFEKYTPLHFFEEDNTFKYTIELLLKNGADVFAKNSDGSTPLNNNSKILHFYMTRVSSDIELQKYVRREFGWTQLHLACYLFKTDEFQDLVRAESADVNAQIFSSSPIWKGCTPLHLLVMSNTGHYETEKAYSMSRILLENGADVTMMNDEQSTPLNMRFSVYTKQNKVLDLLMQYHKNYNVNPVNSRGISHFHIACRFNDVVAVEGFLTYGNVDVNHPIDFFSDSFPGYSPLHLASKLPVIELLINHGANIHAEDVNGCTLLHKAVLSYYYDENVIKKIIECGAEINSPNFYGITPFEMAISSNEMTVEKLTFFIRQGFFVNSCNPITGVGYISMILDNQYLDFESKMPIVELMMNESSTKILGRNTFHHLVTSPWLSKYCLPFFEKLIKAGHDIDEQDKYGKTALHLAVEFRNVSSVQVLLGSGANINIIDVNGNTPLTDSKSRQIFHISGSDRKMLITHAYRLHLLKLDLNQINTDDVLTAADYFRHEAASPDFFQQVEISKEIKLGVRSIRLYDFLSETNAVAIYPYLCESERSQIDEYFENLDKNETLREIRSCLKFQYRNAVKRSNLLFPALESLRWLLGFQLPDLCAENLFQYLRNCDLQNIIQAKIEAEEGKMDVD